MKYHKKISFFLLVLCLVASIVIYIVTRESWDTSDPLRLLKRAREMAIDGEYEQALKRYVWVREWYHREEHPLGSSDEVLLEFAIKYWCELCKNYPVAREKLAAIRDSDEDELRLGKGSIDHFNEVLAINRCFNDEQRTINLFKAIDNSHRESASKYFYLIKDRLIAVREYQLCLHYLSDVHKEFAEIKKRRDFNDAELRRASLGPEDAKKQKQLTEEIFVRGVAQLVEILAGVGQVKEAEQIQKKALAVIDTPTLRTAIDDALRRASK